MGSIRLVYIGDDSLDLKNGDFTWEGLTVGKIYDGLDGWTPDYSALVDECYYIKNDLGLTHLFRKSLFKNLDEIRNEKILNILSHG